MPSISATPSRSPASSSDRQRLNLGRRGSRPARSRRRPGAAATRRWPPIFSAILDTLRAARTRMRALDDGLARGLDADALIAALDDAVGTDARRVGIVCGTGFEDRPELLDAHRAALAALRQRRRDGRRGRRIRVAFADFASDLRHPASATARWRGRATHAAGSRKRRGGSGGSHVGPRGRAQRRRASTASSASPARRSRRCVPRAMGDARACARLQRAMGAPDAARAIPLRRRGAAGRPAAGYRRRARRHAYGASLPRYRLVGLNSVDFLVGGGRFRLLEVNPRPGATLDIFEPPRRLALRPAHARPAAARLHAEAPNLPARPRSAIVYAGARSHAFRRSPGRTGPPTGRRPAARSRPARRSARCSRGRDADGSAAAGRRRRATVLSLDAREGRMSERRQPQRARRPRWSSSMVADAARAADRRGAGRARRDADRLPAPMHPGSIEAGLRIAEICMGGLGTRRRSRRRDATPRWPWHARRAHARIRSIACLASQYAGWALAHGRGHGSILRARLRPGARARAPRAALRGARLSRTSRRPRGAGARERAVRRRRRSSRRSRSDCGVAPDRLTVHLRADAEPRRLRAGRGARARGGAAQGARAEIPARADRRRHRRAPLSPPHPDFVTAMGRTNDAIIYRRPRAALRDRPGRRRARARRRAAELKARATTARPFAEIFKRFNGDFYAIDPMLFSPARGHRDGARDRRDASAPARSRRTCSMLRSPDAPRPAAAARPRVVARGRPARDWHARALAAALAALGVARRRGHAAGRCALRHAARRPGLRFAGLRAACPTACSSAPCRPARFEAVTLRLGMLHALRALGVPVWNDARAIERCVDKSMTSFLLARAGLPTPADLGRRRLRGGARDRAARGGARPAGAEAAVRLAGPRPAADPHARTTCPARTRSPASTTCSASSAASGARLPRFPRLRVAGPRRSPPWCGTRRAGSPT